MSQTQNIIGYPEDTDNEARIIVHAIKSKECLDIFYKKVSYDKFRLKPFKVIAWGIIEAIKEDLEVTVDSVLLKSQTCPIRENITYEFLQTTLNNYPVESETNFNSYIEKLSIDSVKASLVDKVWSSLLPICTDVRASLGDIQERLTYLDEVVKAGYSGSQLGFKSMETVADEFEEFKAKEIAKRTCGFSQLDEHLTFGLRAGQISVTTGLSSMGKSSFALSMMKNLGNKKVPTAQFALEMDSMSLFSKLMAFNTQLPVSTIIKRMDQLSEKEFKLYQWELKRLKENKHIMLNDTPIQSLKKIREQILLLQDFLKTEYIVVVIDLFGKISDLQSSDNFARDYEKKLNILQSMVRELQVHINLVTQIRRDVAYRKNKRPTMADLKNAGALTEVADIMFGIHRPFYDPDTALKKELTYGHYVPDDDDDDKGEEFENEDPNKNIAEIIFLKQRHGKNNILFNFIFDPNTTCFYPITDEYQMRLNKTKLEEGDE